MNGITVEILRELFRNLRDFEALYEAEGTDSISRGDLEITLWDAKYLYDQRTILPPRQKQAIELCLYDNVRERDAAVMMGVSPTNPVAMYATAGLQKLVAMIEAGAFPRFRASA